mgnify:CR=1 FL=1
MRSPSPIHREFLSSARARRTDPSLRHSAYYAALQDEEEQQ